MTLKLDGPEWVGSLSIAAVARCFVLESNRLGIPCFQVLKRPVAILTREKNATKAIRPDGSAISRDELEQLCPGMRDVFEHRCASSRR